MYPVPLSWAAAVRYDRTSPLLLRAPATQSDVHSTNHGCRRGGISIVPEHVRQLANPGVSFHALSPKPAPIPLIAAWRADNETPTLRAMISLVREWLPRIRTAQK